MGAAAPRPGAARWRSNTHLSSYAPHGIADALPQGCESYHDRLAARCLKPGHLANTRQFASASAECAALGLAHPGIYEWLTEPECAGGIISCPETALD